MELTPTEQKSTEQLAAELSLAAKHYAEAVDSLKWLQRRLADAEDKVRRESEAFKKAKAALILHTEAILEEGEQ